MNVIKFLGSIIAGLVIGVSGIALAQTLTGSPIGTPSFWKLSGTTLSPINNSGWTVSINTLNFGGVATGNVNFGGFNASDIGTATAANFVGTSTSVASTFGQASSTLFSCMGTCYFGGTATSTFNSAGALSLATPLSIASGGTNNATAYTSGSVVFSDGTKLNQNNANLFWDNTNNRLGIGTTTPQSKLVVAGSSMSGAVPTAGTTLTLDSTGSDNFLTILANSNNNASVIFGSNTSVLTGSVGYNNSTNKMSFNTNGNNVRMTLDGSGNLGIGTTSPAQLLSVAGNGYLTGALGVGLVNTTANTVNLASGGSYQINGTSVLNGTTLGSGVTGSSLTSVGTITSGTWNGTTIAVANGGTGDTTLSSSQVLYGAGTGVIQTVATSSIANGTNITVTNGSTAYVLGAQPTINLSGVVGIANGGTNNAGPFTGGSVIFSNGVGLIQNNAKFFWDNTNAKLGIGTTTPAGLVELAATAPALFLTDNSAGLNLKHWALQSAAGNFNVGTVADSLGPITTQFTVQNNGNVGIGTTTPFSKFHVSSGANATTTVNFGEVGAAASKACFNTKNSAGGDISFYFAGTTMVVESNLCK